MGEDIDMSSASTCDIKSFKEGYTPAIDKTNPKVQVTQNGEELFTYTNFENLTTTLGSTFEELSGSFEPIKHVSQKKRVKIEIAEEVDGKSLNEAQKTLLKVRERFSFFKNMNDSEVLSVTSEVRMLKLKNGEIIFEQNTSGKDVFFIIGGLVSISVSEDGVDRIEVARLGGETIFGEMAPITKEKRSARAMAAKDGTTLLSFRIDDEIDDKKAKASAILYKNFTSMLADKLIKTNKMVLESRK